MRPTHITFTLRCQPEADVLRSAIHARRALIRANVQGVDADQFMNWDTLKPFLDRLTVGTVNMPWVYVTATAKALDAAADTHTLTAPTARLLSLRVQSARRRALGLEDETQ